MNSATGGTVLFRFKGDASSLNKTTAGVQSGIKGMTKSILAATGITKALSAGFNLIRNSTDRAIQRLDTFEAYPKVLQNFGIATDEAEKSINRIDKTVQGLPTSLDQAVAGVQSLFTVSKDLKFSEKMFRAINDSAMVFANGSTEAVDRFIYSYKKSLSMGKIQGDEFNQMNEAVPGLMDKVAESMGMSFIEMKKGLSEGSVSIDQFNNAMMKLDSEGGAGMEALVISAKSATGGIATNITNAKTAIARGVADMIKSVNTGLQKAGLGNIGELILKAGKAMEQALKGLSPYIITFITKLVELAKWIRDHQTLVKVLVGIIGALVISYKSLMFVGTIVKTFTTMAPIIKSVVSVFTFLKTTVSGLIFIFKTLFAVMMANPIVLIIAGIVALVAIFVLLWNKCEWFRNFWINIWKGMINTIKGAVKTIKAVSMIVINFFKKNWKTLLLFIVNPFAAAFKLLYDNCDGFRKFVDNFIKKVKTLIGNLGNFIKTLPSKLWNILTQTIVKITTFGTNAMNKAKQTGQNIVNGIINFIKQLPSKVWNFLSNTISKITNFASTAVNKAKTMGSNFVNGAINNIKQLPSKVWNSLSNTISKVSTFATNMWNKAKKAGSNFANGVVNAVKGVPSKMANIGGNIARGIWNGMAGLKDWVINKVKNMGKSIINSLKKTLGIKSPSREFAVLGKFSVLGYAEGLEGMRGQLEEAVYDTFSLSPEFANSSALHYSPNVIVNNNVSMETDPLGQTVSKIKTFAGGAKNDYNYGVGV